MGWQHAHAHCTNMAHTHTHKCKQTHRQTGTCRIWSEGTHSCMWIQMMCHSESSSVSNRNTETMRTSGDNRRRGRPKDCVCVCAFVHDTTKHLTFTALEPPNTFFPPAAFPISLSVSEPCEMPWIIHCLNQCALHNWDNYCSTGGSCHFLPLYPTSASWLILILLKQFEVMWKY